MKILSLIMIAVGAILAFAVTADVEGIDIGVVGVILLIVGIVGLIVSLAQDAMPQLRSRRDRYISADGRHIVEEDYEAPV